MTNTFYNDFDCEELDPRDPDYRSVFQRGRDRLIHNAAFRRLQAKTQVFLSGEYDFYRTRLTHSIEVAQIAGSIARYLNSSSDSLGPDCHIDIALVESAALAHDIGHPPFGHRGELALDELMRHHGGFRHNMQVLRVVDSLERRSPDYPGLNLTREVRESLLKHERGEDWPAEFRPRPRHPCLEAQVVDLADSTAYNLSLIHI